MDDLELEALQKRLQQKMLAGQLQDSENPNAELGLNLAGGFVDLLSRQSQAGQDIASMATGIKGPNLQGPSVQSDVQRALASRKTATRQRALDDQNSVAAIQKLIDAKQAKEDKLKSDRRANYMAGIAEGEDGSFSYVPGGAGDLTLQEKRAAIKAKEAEAAAMPGRRDLERQLQEARIASLLASADKANAKSSEPKEYKKEQYDAAGYAQRMKQAEEVFGKLQGSGFDRSKVGRGLEAWLPGAVQSEDSRSNSQAERNFVNAILRRESGAAISPSEFENAAQQYFPRAGDTPEVIAQKTANRLQAVKAIEAAAGGAMGQVGYVNPLAGAKPSGGLTPAEEQELALLEAQYGGSR